MYPQEYSRVSLLSGHQEPRSRACVETSLAYQLARPKPPTQYTGNPLRHALRRYWFHAQASKGADPRFLSCQQPASPDYSPDPRCDHAAELYLASNPPRRFLPTADRRPFSQQAGLRAWVRFGHRHASGTPSKRPEHPWRHILATHGWPEEKRLARNFRLGWTGVGWAVLACGEPASPDGRLGFAGLGRRQWLAGVGGVLVAQAPDSPRETPVQTRENTILPAVVNT
jgi:hypothetical protein